jgi:hypothetical protein
MYIIYLTLTLTLYRNTLTLINPNYTNGNDAVLTFEESLSKGLVLALEITKNSDSPSGTYKYKYICVYIWIYICVHMHICIYIDMYVYI